MTAVTGHGAPSLHTSESKLLKFLRQAWVPLPPAAASSQVLRETEPKEGWSRGSCGSLAERDDNPSDSRLITHLIPRADTNLPREETNAEMQCYSATGQRYVRRPQE